MENMREEALQKSLKTALANKDVGKILNIVKNEKLDVNYRDISHDLETFLMKISFVDIPEENMVQILDALWEREPDLNLQDSVGRTALMHACIAGREDVTKFLLSKKETRIEMFDFDGNSVLIPAIKNGNLNLVKMILEKPGTMPLLTIYNSCGETPYDLAKKLGNQNMIELIELYQNKLFPVPQQVEIRKKKKSKKKDYSLPPAYSPRTEHQYILKNDLKNYTQESSPLLSNSPQWVTTKYQKQPYIDNDAHSLWLTSPKLTRSKNTGHRNEGLPDINLPSIISQNSPPKATEMKKRSRKKERRNSISLPDLREMPGGLVASGDNTPAEGYNDSSDEFSDEDVFDSVQIQYMSPRKTAFTSSNTLRKTISQKTIVSLPDINTPTGGIASPHTKRSCSEEQLNKRSVLNKLL